MQLTDHLEKLKYFYQIAKLGSMRKASQTLFITQPSLTKSIKNLEEALGFTLFNRLPTGIKLTDQGKTLYEYCHSLFASVKDIEQKLLNPQNPMAGSIRVGTYDSIGIYFWPKFLKNFLPKHPQLKLEISTGRSTDIQKKLIQAEIDLALIIDPLPHPQINIVLLQEDYFKFYQSSKKRRVYSQQDQAPIILMDTAHAGGNSLRNKLSMYPQIKQNFYTTSSLETVKEFTLNGLGIGLLPKMVARDSLINHKLEEVKFKGTPRKGIGKHQISLTYSVSRQNSPIIQKIIQEVQSAWKL